MRDKKGIMLFKPFSILLPLLLLTIITPAVYGQDTTTISGKVTAVKDNSPLAGANVILKGQKRNGNVIGTQTDSTGAYQLKVPSLQGTLVFSFIGFQKKKVKIKGRSTINVQLKSKVTKTKKKLVVIGYGKQKESYLSSSVSSVGANQLETQSVTSVGTALAGQVAGVNVQQTTGAPGGGLSISIRGKGSISAGNQPLYVVDGVPLNTNLRNSSAQGGGGQQAVNPMASLNPDDIASINILKGASATSIYGSRGSNGVVIITTKEGRSGESHIDLKVTTGWQHITHKLPIINKQQYIQKSIIAKNIGWARLSPDNKRSDPNSVRSQSYKIPNEFKNPSQVGYYNWQNALYRTAPRRKYELSASGGTENVRYYISGNYLNQEGIVTNTYFKNYGFRANINADISDHIHVGFNFAPSYSLRNRSKQEGIPYYGGATAIAVSQDPFYPIFNDDGSYSYSYTFHYGDGTTSRHTYTNPIANVRAKDRKLDQFRTMGNIFASIDFLNHFTFKSNFAGIINFFNKNFYSPSFVANNGLPPSVPTATSFSSRNINWTNANTLTFKDSFHKKNNLKILLGLTEQRSDLIRSDIQANGFPTDYVHTINAGIVNGGNSYETGWTLVSLLGRVEYNYAHKYFVKATVRRDGSSRFGANHKWGIFPSGSVAWRMDQEKFMQNIPFISEFKLRAGYGISGNSEIGNYASIGTIGQSNYILGSGKGEIANGLVPTSLANPDLTWEKASELDIGMDVGFVNNRLHLSADIYNKINKDLLLNVQLPYASGFSSMTRNLGQVRNRGLELALDAVPLQAQGFQWRMHLNFSINRNKVEKLGPEGAPIYAAPTKVLNLLTSITRIGKPIGSYYGYVFQGVFKNRQELNSYPHFSGEEYPGNIKVKDLNGDGKIDENDKTIIGNNYPDFTYGIRNTFHYKGINLSILLQGTKGNQVLNLLKRQGGYTFAGKQFANYWQSPEKPGDGKTFSPGGNIESNRVISTFYVDDASFLRIKNVTLGYRLPATLFGSNSVLRKARIYMSVQNLYTFTPFKGYNPQVNTVKGTNPLTPGIAYGTYPLSRTITLGIDVGF
jgi:TonB-linked SusC/RagA family outer membrane protein